MGRIIDFTYSRWGHALHGDYMFRKKADTMIERLKDRLLKRRRYTVTCHVTPFPCKGDKIKYLSKRGEIIADIVYVKHALNPRDMYQLELIIKKLQ